VDLTVGRIAVLPPALANQIAAGEVVERPASVVKELVENAIDAGSRRIVITVEHGGKSLIRVEDDGEGMTPEDARLAVERHATSKIRLAADLEAIVTLGFRGEALPSIASVSRFRLRTRARGAIVGTEVMVEGGALQGVTEVGAPEGTLVEVRDLFFNLPARRKFLKSDGPEAAQISRLVTQLALGAPTMGLTLVSNGRRLLDCPPASDHAERFFQTYGERQDLVAVRREGGGVRVDGYIAPLAEQGPRRGPQHVYVNGRIVRDKTIAHAIQAAYAVATVKERSPEVHLFLQIDPERVDVNVHPTKAEVRFLDQSLVHEVLRRALSDALGSGPVPQLQLQAGTVPIALPSTPALPGVFSLGHRQAADGSGGHGPGPTVHGPQSEDDGARFTDSGLQSTVHGPQSTDHGLRSAGDAAGGWPEPPVGAVPADPDDPLRPMVPLGQFRNTYIIAVDPDGISIIDQHVAHERVLYERIYERLTASTLESQRLIAPVILDFDPSQRAALAAHREDLLKLGFDLEEFGGDTVRVTAMPALLPMADIEPSLRSLAQDLDGLDRGSRVHDVLKQMAATMACHAAVKANDPLTPEKMRHILDELHRTAYSTVCPHGRPVVLRLTRREIEKNFQRI
jgi:DNA mismatch repair protein MutL